MAVHEHKLILELFDINLSLHWDAQLQAHFNVIQRIAHVVRSGCA